MAKKKIDRSSRSAEEGKEHEHGEDNRNLPVREENLYKILGVEKTASQQEIRKTYYKLALHLHPDKNPGDEEAKEKFQLLQKVMSVLGDEEKRAVYDQTGCIDDDADFIKDVQDLHNYFRDLYKRVTIADIEEFEANYRGSDTEIKDMKDLYTRFKGNMSKFFCSMICSDPKLDSHRFKDIIDEAIAAGELKSTSAYEKWAKKISEIEPPTNMSMRAKLKKQHGEDLVALICQRRRERKDQFESMFSALEKKYSGNNSIEPTEEEFEAARNRLETEKKAIEHTSKHRKKHKK